MARDGNSEEIIGLLTTLASEIIQETIDPEEPLVAQGLDSVAATALLDSIRSHGYEADYSSLLKEASIYSLSSSLRSEAREGPTPPPAEFSKMPFPLTGPQLIWAELEQQGWGAWANISVCISMPARLIPAAFLPAIAQSLCDVNDAMRMVLVPSRSTDGVQRQRVLTEFQMPVRMREAPALERDAMRLIEAFEGEDASPLEPSTRAMVLASAGNSGRHWLCITMHHMFVDRVGMHNLAAQLRAMIIENELRITQNPPVGYVDYAFWQTSILDKNDQAERESKLRNMLAGADISPNRPVPRLANEEKLDLGALPPFSALSSVHTEWIESIATQLATTVPLLLHSLFSALVPRLTGDEEAEFGKCDTLLCHVVANRESHATLQNLVGCLDTSVPVAVRLSEVATLRSLCDKTRQAFAEAHQIVSSLPRGGWFGLSKDDPGISHHHSFFERVPHINIIRDPGDEANADAAADIRTHSVQRLQRTRWGLLLRITLPASCNSSSNGRGSKTSVPAGIRVSAFAEHQPLAILAHYCFVELLGCLRSESLNSVGELMISDLVDRAVGHAAFSAGQVRRTSEWASRDSSGEAFIWEKLIQRQQRWYKHDERRELLRDNHNRFIGTRLNPFPFTQLDKLKERRFLDALDVPQPRLLHQLQQEGLQDSLVEIAPSLPGSFAIKPVGAGHSFGVSLIREGMDLTRNGTPFNAETIASELTEMADRGFCVHEDNVFPFNFSSFLIEELVIDENGFDTPTDYKCFMMGRELLWIQVHFKAEGHTWVATVDANFELLPQPAWDPATCWRTHRALLCTEQAMVTSRKPRCLPEILAQSERLGARLNIFVRLDWYADKKRGALMGEITSFPHMLQPRTFYSAWANQLVRTKWQDPDGGTYSDSNSIGGGGRLIRTMERLDSSKPHRASLEDFLQPDGKAPWAVGTEMTHNALFEYVNAFDLAARGVVGGDCVALLVENGLQLAGLLLATMNRYVALPVDTAHPSSLLVALLQSSAARALLVISGTKEAHKANDAARSIPGLIVIELELNSSVEFATLPPERDGVGLPAVTPKLGPDDRVLQLHTSGTSGEPKIISFTLSRIMRAGAVIAHSLRLSPADLGISMLPLHHIGGISCNLIAPLLAGTPMRFHKSFDPKGFFDAVEGKEGATWCYLVPTMWEMLLDYAAAHPELKNSMPCSRLRFVRSAGSDLPHHFALELAAFFGESVSILPTYGMTEAMPIAAPPLPYLLERPGSVGPVLPTVSVEIVDPSESGNLSVLADGKVGEVTVAGPTVIPEDEDGGSPSLNNFTPRGYFRTGDMGHFAPDGSGWLYITGRIKEAINRGGETIAPADVEAVLLRYPGWKEAGMDIKLMVFARAHTSLGEDVALAVAPGGTQLELDRINAWAQQHLPSSMLPQTLVHLPELPRSVNGKLMRSRFAERLNLLLEPGKLGKLQIYILDEIDAVPVLQWESYAQLPGKIPGGAGTDATLESVLTIVRDFVGAGLEVGPDTRLKDVGVNSLASLELSERLSRRYRVALPPWIISDYPTARALFTQLLQAQGTASNTEAMSTEKTSNSGVPRSAAKQSSNRPLRILFLHGEGADADLADLSMQATKWTGQLENMMEFIFIDAPHPCPPKPEFHPAAVDAGYYQKQAYRSWGATESTTLAESIAAVVSKLDEFGPVDGIGGICDGGLIAALVASRRTDLRLYLNIASSPLSRLPEKMRESALSITCSSIHFISSRDELLSFEELLDIPKYCGNALLLQHDGGHAMPVLDSELKHAILSTIDGIGFASGQNEAPAPSLTTASAQSLTDDDYVNSVSSPPGQFDNPLEEAVGMIWAAGIGISLKSVGADDTFEDLGGDSLSTLRILYQLEQEFDLDARKSFRTGFTTVRETARTLHALGASRSAPENKLASRVYTEAWDTDHDLETAYAEMLRCTNWYETRLRGDSIGLYATPKELADLLSLPKRSLNRGNRAMIASLKRNLFHPEAVLAHLRWRRRIIRFIENAPDNSSRWSRTAVSRDAILYHTSEGDRSRKQLIVGFSGSAMRLMMPTYMMLCSLDPQRYDLLLLKDPGREEYINGIDAMGESITALASFLDHYVVDNSYHSGIALGTSAGGLPAIYVALKNRWPGAVVFGPVDPERHPDLSGLLLTESEQNVSTSILLNYGEKHKDDRIIAAKVKKLISVTELKPDPRFRKHNVPYALFLRGELAEHLERQFSEVSTSHSDQSSLGCCS